MGVSRKTAYEWLARWRRAGAAVGADGRVLVEFFTAIMRGDGKTLGVRQVPLATRVDAARWLGERAFGKPPQTIEIAEIEREQTVVAVQTLADMPDHLKAEIRGWLLERRDRYLAEQRAEARMRSFLPDPADGDGAR